MPNQAFSWGVCVCDLDGQSAVVGLIKGKCEEGFFSFSFFFLAGVFVFVPCTVWF